MEKWIAKFKALPEGQRYGVAFAVGFVIGAILL